jgi:hypothetical protein
MLETASTSGPVYAGAIVVFLFVLGIFLSGRKMVAADCNHRISSSFMGP